MKIARNCSFLILLAALFVAHSAPVAAGCYGDAIGYGQNQWCAGCAQAECEDMCTSYCEQNCQGFDPNTMEFGGCNPELYFDDEPQCQGYGTSCWAASTTNCTCYTEIWPSPDQLP